MTSSCACGRPASEFLDAAGNYIGDLNNLPYVDPTSEGFSKLPREVQQHSLRQELAAADAMLNEAIMHMDHVS